MNTHTLGCRVSARNHSFGLLSLPVAVLVSLRLLHSYAEASVNEVSPEDASESKANLDEPSEYVEDTLIFLVTLLSRARTTYGRHFIPASDGSHLIRQANLPFVAQEVGNISRRVRATNRDGCS